jgi:hypothetical protein
MTTPTFTSEADACTFDVDDGKKKRANLPTITVPFKEKYTTLPNTKPPVKMCLDNREVRG